MMRRTVLYLFVPLALILLFTLQSEAVRAASPADAAKIEREIDEAQSKGLPKTVVSKLKKLSKLHLQNNNQPAALAALVRRIAVEASVAEDPLAEQIELFERELSSLPETARAVGKAVLAEWYWSYLRGNLWRFANRTKVEEGDRPADFRMWDIAALVGRVEALYSEALVRREVLKLIPISKWEPMLRNAKPKEPVRPTLYDFTAWRFLQFYSDAAQVLPPKTAPIVFERDSKVFAESGEFLASDLKEFSKEDFGVRALQLFQEVMAFHRGDAEPTAFIDADLLRLKFVDEHSVAEAGHKVYRQRLARVVLSYPGNATAALAQVTLARFLMEEKEYKKAHEILIPIERNFAKWRSGWEANQLVRSILASELAVSPADAKIPIKSAESSFNISYRNLNRIYVRLYPFNWSGVALGEFELEKRLGQKPHAEFNLALKEHGDYLAHEQKVQFPPLDAGHYLVVVSSSKGFSRSDNLLLTYRVNVTNLAPLFEKNRKGLTGRVLDAVTGEPLSGVTVSAWQRVGSVEKQVTNAETDGSGRFEMRIKERGAVALMARKGGDLASSSESPYWYNYEAEAPAVERRVVFFTDRALYRPGQSVGFKALLFERRSQGEEYRPVENGSVDVELRDANGQLVTKASLRSNEMGSAAGSFVAPSGRLLGRFRMNATGGFLGGQDFSVEEYKRPKFEVTIKEPQDPIRLGKEITVRGSAVSYSGVAVANAAVRYRVRRALNIPWWCRFRYGNLFVPGMREEVELKEGSTTTDSEGKFTLSFNADADRMLAEAKDVSFVFSIHGAVVDATGEERSSDLLLHAGFGDLQAGFEPTDRLDSPFPLKATLTSLAGKPQKIGDGLVTIYRLEEPKRLARDLDWRGWKNGVSVFTTQIVNADSGSEKASISPSLAPGAYRAIFSTKDGRGITITSEFPFLVLDKAATRFPIRIPYHLALKGERLETMDLSQLDRTASAKASVGETFEAIWGTGYEKGRAYVEFFHRGEVVNSFYTSENATQQRISIPIKEAFRGGLHLRISFVREHRFYSHLVAIDVPWDNKSLKIEKRTFRTTLKPGQTEEWTLRILGADAKAAAAEVVTTLYDASLDAILPHSWSSLDWIWPRDSAPTRHFAPFTRSYPSTHGMGLSERHVVIGFSGERYPSFAPFVGAAEASYASGGGGGRTLESLGVKVDLEASADAVSEGLALNSTAVPAGELSRRKSADADSEVLGGAMKKDGARQAPIVRSNLRETALFYPQVFADSNGDVTLRFTTPDALTTWKFMAFAHTKKLQSGFLTESVVTSKELMLEPNLPRFLRAGDALTLVARLSNTTRNGVSGYGKIRILDFETRGDLTSKFVKSPAVDFKLSGKESRVLRWEIAVPSDFLKPLIVEMVAHGDGFSDGEEGAIPVLSSRVFLTESKAFSLRKPGEHRIEFNALRNASDRKSVVTAGAALEYTANANWTVVQALTYLMEYPFECVEQTFNRLYANMVGAFIVSKEPQIAKVFSEWKKSGEQIKSPLERNESLKNVANLEMPWLLEGQSESASRARLGMLFDADVVRKGAESSMTKLLQTQGVDGAWSWYPGGQSDLYMTMYVLGGFSRLERVVSSSSALRRLFSSEVAERRQRGMRWVDGEMERLYRDAVRRDKAVKPYASTISSQYLYLRSFYPKMPLVGDAQKSFEFWRAGAKNGWLNLSLLNQAQVALAFVRSGEVDTARVIMKSLRERGLRSEEMGAWWGEYAQTRGWWFDAPVETQAALVELFSEMGNAAELVADMKVWLVQQKRTQAWHSTKATSDAVYALLLEGENPLRVKEESVVRWGMGGSEHLVKMNDAERGIGYVKETLAAERAVPELATLSVKKSSSTVSWGAIYWHYFVNVNEVKSASSGVEIQRDILRLDRAGSLLATGTAVREAVVGDTLRVRITINSDRDYEYVHLKDLRGAGFEPEAMISGYRHQGGLWYYETPRDTGTSFFIDFLPKGKHVFEYTLKVQYAGTFDAGFAEMQSLYAPEFGARSAGGGSFRVQTRS